MSLIESLLLDIPIPPIYLGQEPANRLEVIDGQQRLTTLIRFVDNQFYLERLASMPSLNGKHFKDLTEEQQQKIETSTIRTVIIDAGKNTALRYEVFERLNRGAVPLKEQEIRNCMFRGEFCELLKALESDRTWRKLKGSATPDPRFIEREMVLRFFAFVQRIEHYTGKLKQFLTKSMEVFAQSCEREPARVDELRSMFLQTVQNINIVFGTNAARVYRIEKEGSNHGQWEPKFSVGAFDVQASALLGHAPVKVQSMQEQIREAYIYYLLTEPRIINAISGQGTTRREPTRLRWFGFKSHVDQLLSGTTVEPRFFPYEVRRKLFEASDVCQICKNQIHSFEDCTVDHITPYSRGGKTVTQNSQLAHRTCNAYKNAAVTASAAVPVL